MKRKILPLLLLTFSTFSYAQNCDCESNFNWVKKTFEENDAGFEYIISKKGRDAYELHSQIYLEKAKQLPNDKECAIVIDKWVRFFRDGHIGIKYLKEPVQETNFTVENIPVNEKDFKKYLSKKKTQDKYEGIWSFGSYVIAIKRRNNEYVGTILYSTNKNWKVGDVKTVFTENDGTLYLGNKSPQKISKITTIGNTYLKLNTTILQKKYPEIKEDATISKEIQWLDTAKPLFEKLNENTAYLRIPDFEISEKKHIDSIIEKNKDIILATKNLIIDVRNNPGGSDASYSSLIPFLYTNPIRTVGTLFYSTPLNNQRMQELSQNPDFDKESQEGFKKYYETLNASLGKFVDIFNKDVFIQTRKEITRYPENIGIVINEKNGSTTEQFLLTAKQSKKVKLYGKTTRGMLDISNVNIIESPCKDFELYYGLSRSYRIPDFAIDDIGLQPDYFIDGSVSEYNWIKFVDETLNSK
ncbi:S41 family peptidase [Flavobacterium lindanitolerans]|jgi:C-terminal processing protease CtpA/Prc|uniref:S41 family peptidase n=1 Tax=Flavobacterium lindanitolerans TaxID=428988 RepID=UPI0023F16D26|nr:S41 family peptidase [Flavobacterium lindanitolerans]